MTQGISDVKNTRDKIVVRVKSNTSIHYAWKDPIGRHYAGFVLDISHGI